MAIRVIESFMFDGYGGTMVKAAKRGYANLTKAAQALGSDNITSLSETNHLFFTTPGRYAQNDNYNLVAQAVDEYLPQGCPSCVSDYANFGSYFKIPIPPTELDTYGVVGFSLKVNILPSGAVAGGFQDDSDNDGFVFFGLGGNASNTAQIVCGIRALDNKVYLKVIDTAANFAVSTGVTGTNSSKYRGYHNNDDDCVVSSFTPTSGVWYTVEVKYRFSGTAGHVLLYINGVKVAETADDIAFSTTFRDAVFLAAMYSLVTANPSAPEFQSDPYNEFDDFYMLDSTGDRNTDYLGNYRVRYTYPTADHINEGYESTTPYSAMQIDDDGSTYVAPQSGEIQTFEFNDLTDVGSKIRAVKFNFNTYFENNDNIRILPLSEHGGVMHSGFVNQIPASGGGYIHHAIPMESSLVTGGDWTRAEINDGYHGFTIFS